MTNILEIGNVKYENNVITLHITVLERAEISENINIWLAEYDVGGALVGLKKQSETITESKDVEIKYTRSENAVKTKLFVWNSENLPYCGTQYIE